MKLIFITIFCFLFILRFDLYSSSTHNKVSLGIDELERMAFSPLKGKRVGLITNQTGVNSKGNKTRSVLFNAKNVIPVIKRLTTRVAIANNFVLKLNPLHHEISLLVQ